MFIIDGNVELFILLISLCFTCLSFIVLILIDYLLVIAELMLDFIKLQKLGGPKLIHSTTSHHEDNPKLELAI